MSASTPSPSAEQLVRVFTVLTVAFCGALALVFAVAVLWLVPDPVVGRPGLAIGVALALVSWFGSRWITDGSIARAAERGTRDQDASATVRAAVFLGIAFAEAPALVGLTVAMVLGHDVGPLVVSTPVAIAAIVVNASGPGAVRRHLERVGG